MTTELILVTGRVVGVRVMEGGGVLFADVRLKHLYA
jgi:hypothetical protein